MIALPTLQVAAGVIITLFLLQVVRSLTANASNPIFVGVNDGADFLVRG
jgi:hypothetical protein